MKNNTHQRSSMPVVLQCMRIDKTLKRYYWSKYNWLKTHSGAKYAAATFKQLRQVLMSYIDASDRVARKEEFIALCPVRKNGWLRKLFAYADTQPITVIQFLKLYTVEEEPVVTPEEAALCMHEELERAEPAAQNTLLDAWLTCLTRKSDYKNLLYQVWKGGVPSVEISDVGSLIIDKVAADATRLKGLGLSMKDYFRFELSYFDKMKRILTPKQQTDEECLFRVMSNLPTMEDYAFFGKGSRPVPKEYDQHGILLGEENPFETDIMGLLSLEGLWPIDTILDVLPEGITETSVDVNPPDEGYEYVGYIRQIPKKGTVQRRAIADPNKFLQAGLVPFQKFLRSMSYRVPRNCQFAQDKLDEEIRKHLNTGFAGSVDLHQATDWLPLDWFLQIEDALCSEWYPIDVEESVLNEHESAKYHRLIESRDLFMRMARAQWDNEGLTSSWKRGQPLGTLPSFEVLTLTHFCVLEALSWYLGHHDSPYALLGDDVVIFDEGVRRMYIDMMEEYGVPLSLHKSYSSRLTEFAGKIHVKNQVCRYATDIPYLDWSNLFDYQRSTGVVVPYRSLPKDVKIRLGKYASTYQSGLRPEDLYAAMQLCAGCQTRAKITDVIGDLVTNYYLADRDGEPEPVRGLYGFVYGGYAGCYNQEVNLPTSRLRKKAKWWTKKVRPDSTTSIASKCTQAH